jgi:hypothetical protein
MTVGIRAALLAVVVLALAIVTGCAGGEEEARRGQGATPEASKKEAPRPVEAVRLAYEKTEENGSARFSLRTEVSGMPQAEGMPGEYVMTGAGVSDFRTGDARMVLRMPMLGEMEIRLKDKVMYQRFPQGMLPSGKPWVRADLEELAREKYGSGFSEMQEGTQPQDLTGQLEYLRGVSDSVEELGREEIRGVPTTHYRAVIDLQKAAPKDPEAREAYEESIKGLGTDTLPMEVWLDEEGRVRRYEMTAPVAVPESGATTAQQAKTTVVVEYYDFGVPVNVQAPPPEQTIDFSELTSQYAPAA